MDMDEKKNYSPDYDQTDLRDQEELIRELRSRTDDIDVPPALEPEAIEEMLSHRRKVKSRRYRRRYIAGAAAACVCLAVGITAGYLTFGPGGREADSDRSTAAIGDESGEGARAQKIVSAENYDEIYRYIQEEQRQAQRETRALSDGAAMESADSSDAAGGASDSGSPAGYSGTTSDSTSAPYSDTNVREEGVGEADIVKTDGENLYIAYEDTVEIVGITEETMQEYEGIDLEGDCYASELYVKEDKLVVLYTKNEYSDGETGYDGYFRNYTCADVYNISDPKAPQKIASFSQSGSYNTMRVRNEYVYVLSDFYADAAVARSDTRAYVPEVGGSVMDAEDIYMPQRGMGSSYTVITAFSLDNPKEKTDSKAVFGTAGTCYVSTDNIYITENYYDNNDADVTQTSIRKISYKDGKLQGSGQTKVNGTLNDSFSIDEYNGYLRLVTTVSEINSGGLLGDFFVPAEQQESEDTNSLYILDENLEITGEIHDLARDESIYSARLMGDVGYFVTFKQVDPLFSVDLSDPRNPKIIGELKIPGFSEYLHPYGDGKLLGIGMDVDEEGITTEGVKITMFDVSDPSDVREEDTYILEDMYGTDVGYDYKAVFVDVEKNLFGFLSYGDKGVYTIFTYDEEEGLKEVFSRELTWYGSTRGLYVGEKFYLVSGSTVESFRLSDFEKADDIVL